MTTHRALRGLNLGGWLIVEKWITPSLFRGTDAIDEYTLSQTSEGRRRVATHRRTFMREQDFKWMAAHGIELLRIPFGHWLISDDSDYVGGIEQLDWAMKMAEKYELNVLLDIHGLPGSQNGKFHSGRTGEVAWRHDESTVICQQVAERYKESPALWGIEIINEPHLSTREYPTLLRYYRQVYRELKKILPRHTYIVFSDAFHPWLLAGALIGKHVAMDVHWYAFGSRRMDEEQLLVRMRRRARTLRILQRLHPVIVGEWSAVVSRAASSDDPARRRQLALTHYDMQRHFYDGALAHCYWTYKTEESGLWSYRHLHEKVLTEVAKNGKIR